MCRPTKRFGSKSNHANITFHHRDLNILNPTTATKKREKGISISNNAADPPSADKPPHLVLVVKHHVSFAPRAQMRRTIPLQDYSPQEIKACWYSVEEKKSIFRQCAKQVHEMNRGIELQGKDCCARGLESHTRVGAIAKSVTRVESIQAVLDEQGVRRIRQEQQGVAMLKHLLDNGGCGAVDSANGRIAKIYHQATSSSQLWVSVVGMRDEREVYRL